MIRDHLDEISALYASGMSLGDIAKKFGVSRQAVHSVCKKLGALDGIERPTRHGRCQKCSSPLRKRKAISNTRPDEYCDPCAEAEGHWENPVTHVVMTCVVCGSVKEQLKTRIKSQRKRVGAWKLYDESTGECVCHDCYVTRRKELYDAGVLERPDRKVRVPKVGATCRGCGKERVIRPKMCKSFDKKTKTFLCRTCFPKENRNEGGGKGSHVATFRRSSKKSEPGCAGPVVRDGSPGGQSGVLPRRPPVPVLPGGGGRTSPSDP